MLEFVDTHANEVFKLNAFGLLPEHVVRLILAREGLQAEEQAKYNGVYTWCEHYCRSYELASISDVMRNFLHLIQFHKISRQVLLNEIYPTHTVPDSVILIALAEQVSVCLFVFLSVCLSATSQPIILSMHLFELASSDTTFRVYVHARASATLATGEPKA